MKNCMLSKIKLYVKDKKMRQEAKTLCLNTNISKNLPLKKSIESELNRYCKKTLNGQANPFFLRILVALKGDLQYGYLPDDFIKNRLTYWLNPPSLNWYVVDKGNLELIFGDDAVPVLFTHRKGIVRTRENKIYSLKEFFSSEDGLTRYFSLYREICVKLLGYSKGEGIFFAKNKEHPFDFAQTEQDFAAQPSIKQHKDLSLLNKTSINSIRVLSLCWEGKIHLLSSYIRIGRENKRMDHNGISVPINLTNGFFSDTGYDMEYNPYTKHPDSNILFKNIKFPSMELIKETVVRAHSKVFTSKFLGWDIAVVEDGTPKILEVNSYPHPFRAQFFNGPLFQEHTDKILHTWFKK